MCSTGGFPVKYENCSLKALAAVRGLYCKRERLVPHTYVAGCISHVPISPQRDNAAGSRHFSFATCREIAECIYNTGNPPEVPAE